jgi:hypothetical protein
MKKHCLHIALLALAAFFAFLSACGGEDAENLDGNGWDKIQLAINDLVNQDIGPIAECSDENKKKDGCPKYGDIDRPSSSSKDNPDDDDSSSSQPSDSSSSKDDSSSSDDNSYIEPSSPAEASDDEYCPEEASDVPDKFTCGWEPAEVVSGDSAKIKMNISDSECEEVKASLEIGKFRKGYAYFPVGKRLQTSGTYPDFDANGQALTGATDKVWPMGDSALVVNGRIRCGAFVCPKKCEPLSIKKAPDPIATGTLAFSNVDYSTNIYFIGTKPQVTSTIKITNNNTPPGNEANCTDLRIEITGPNNYKQTSNYPIAVDGTTTFTQYTATDTLPPVTAEGNITAKAIAKCRGSEHEIKTATPAKLVPNPSLDGACKWIANGKDVSSGTTTGKGGVPSNQKLINSYGRCKAAGVTAITDNNYSLLTKDYSNYDGTAPTGVWPNNGIDNLTAEHTYSNVKSNIVCDPVVDFPVCPALSVVAGSACDGATKMSTLCPGIDWDDIQWNTKPPRINGAYIKSGCYWVESWGGTGDKGFPDIDNFLINGKPFSKNGNKNDWDATKIDGGIYIYVPTNTKGGDPSGPIIPGSEQPFCVTGIRKLKCGAVPTAGMIGHSVNPPSLSCNDGTPTNPTFTGTLSGSSVSIDFANITTAGSYSNIKASATCNSQLLGPVNCSGTMVVEANDGCGYEPSYCNNKYSKSALVPKNKTTEPGSDNCVFVANLTKFCSNGKPSYINGVNVDQGSLNCWGNKPDLASLGVNSKVDGGYYVYQAGGNGGAWEATAGTPVCSP